MAKYTTGKNANEGYVFYNSLGDIGNPSYWTSVRDGAHSYFSKVELLTEPSSGTASYLYNMGMAELNKEKRMLAEYFGVPSLDWDENNYREIIEAMNQALNIEKVFKRVVERVNQSDKEAGRIDTTIASVYGDFLMRRLNRDLPFFFNNFLTKKQITEGDIEGFGRRFETMIKTAMDGALDTMLRSKTKNSLGNNEQIWLEALSAINEIEDFRNRFGVQFFSRYGFNRIRDRIKRDIADGVNYERLKDKIMTTYKQEINGRLDSQAIAGYVAKELAEAFQAAGLRGSGISWSTKSLSQSKNLKIDSMTILGEGNLNFDEFNAYTKIDANNELTNFYNNVVSGLNNATVIYENTKKYNLGSNFNGFNGGSRRLDDIEDILNHIGYYNADAFINKIKQTMPGAIYANTDYQQQAARTLAAAVGFLLFDDIETIGDAGGDVDVIHIFRLSDVVIPLSFLLIELATAMREAENNMTNYVRVQFHLPDSLAYSYPQADKTTEGSDRRWVNQANIASAQSTLTINFLSNFKQLLRRFFN